MLLFGECKRNVPKSRWKHQVQKSSWGWLNKSDVILMLFLYIFQFSCAAPIEGVNNKNQRDVWVCNSDGYVGHMCLLSLQPEPIVTLNTPVPGCNSRILCICAVPGLAGFKRYVLGWPIEVSVFITILTCMGEN